MTAGPCARRPRGARRRRFSLLLALLAGIPLATPPRAAAAGPAALLDLALAAERARAVAACETRLVGAELPSAEALEAAGATIGQIAIDAQEIFDLSRPGEDFWAFRLANRLHVNTEDGVIRRRLLVRPGDPLVARRLAESERLLRAEKFLYSARVEPVAYCGGVADLAVETRDVWSLKAGTGLTRKGGENTWHIEVQDANFLGRGTDLELSYENDVDRSTLLARYRDKDFLFRRLRLDLNLADRSDGALVDLGLSRPFYSLETPWAAGVRLVRDHRIDRRFRLGKTLDGFDVEQRFAELSAGLSTGLRGDYTYRAHAGLTYDEVDFSWKPGEALVLGVPLPRRLAYPWIAVETVEEGFLKERNLDRIDRIEDLNLGRRASASLGFAAKDLGSDRNALLFSASYADGFTGTRNDLFLVSTKLSGRWREGGVENGRLAAEGRLLRRTFGRHLLAVTLRLAATVKLDPESQLLLGGDNGLRGYPLRYQEGNRQVLFSIEQRFFDSREFFHLLRFGAAVFFDAGQGWSVGEPGPKSLGLLHNIGVGLRVATSRSANAAMIHLDLAYPLYGPRDVRKLQWLVTTSDTF